MGRKRQEARKLIIAMSRAGVSTEQLVRDAGELGVRARFVYRTLGYKREYNRAEGRWMWVSPMMAAP